MEDIREEKTVLCVFGEKAVVFQGSNTAEERKNLLFRCIGGDYYLTRVTNARGLWYARQKKYFGM